MTRECHVRFWERAGVRFPRATRQMVVTIQGRRMYLWRAVDSEGEILDLLVQTRRGTAAALRRHCHGNRSKLKKPPASRFGQAAAVAVCQACAASVLKVRSVRREMRWR